MWMKRVAIFSLALTGGYVYFNPQYVSTYLWTKSFDQSAQSDKDSSYIYLSEHIGNDFDEFRADFMSKTNMPIYWNLFMLCKSKDRKVRHRAVKSLSNLSALEKWQYIMIAQACDIRTCVGLSRSFNASPYFFCPPPFRDLNVENLQSDLLDFLSYLPPSNDPCIQNFRKMVIKSGKSIEQTEYSLDLEEGDPSVLFHSQQKRKILYFFDKHILQILLSYSATSSYRSLMTERGILKLLLKVWKSHENDSEIISLIGQILANLTLEEKYIRTFYMSGWIGILASWSKSSNVIVSLPAAKALANLDKDDICPSLYDDGIYILNPLFRQSQYVPSADVIFVHGLRGATFWTWRQCDTQKKINENKDIYNRKEKSHAMDGNTIEGNYTMCWPKDWLAADIPSLRIISVDYKTFISNWGSYCVMENDENSINKKSKEIINKLLLSNVGERPIIWIAHSMGGLIVKQILAEAFESKIKEVKSLAAKTSGIIFYSVPHKGSEFAKRINSASHILLPSNDIAQLEKDSPSLLSLHQNFKNIVLKYDIPVLSFGETKKTNWGLSSSILVSLDSTDPEVGEFHALPVDHLSTCKPVSTDSTEYIKVLEFIQNNLSNTILEEVYSLRIHKNVFEISKILSLIP